MGMGSAPASGFVLELTEELLVKYGYKWEDHLKDPKSGYIFNGDNFHDWLEWKNNVNGEITLNIDGYEIDIDIFFYDGDLGDQYDELEDETYYLIFEESYLFEKAPTPLMLTLTKNGNRPALKSWVVFG